MKISNNFVYNRRKWDFLWHKILEAWHYPWHTLIFRKISKSTSSLISDRKLQFVSITLLANRMEPRSSCRFVLKIKYCPGLLYVGRIRHKNPASCWLDKLLLIFFFYLLIRYLCNWKTKIWCTSKICAVVRVGTDNFRVKLLILIPLKI